MAKKGWRDALSLLSCGPELVRSGRPIPLLQLGTELWISEDRSSAHRFLHERADPCLFGGGQLFQREGSRPHGAFVEVALTLKPNVAYLVLNFCALWKKQTTSPSLAYAGILPGFRREGWRSGSDDGMEPFGHGAIRSWHVDDLREHVAFPGRPIAQCCPGEILRGTFGAPTIETVRRRNQSWGRPTSWPTSIRWPSGSRM
jgi:hypothetical protein